MKSIRPAALIVEDQPFVGMVASDILRESGFETFHAFDANDALDMLDEHPEIELVATELRLPGEVDGLELCRRIEMRSSKVQLIVTASSGEVAEREIPKNAKLLRKPYATSDLLTLIQEKVLLADA